MAKAGISVARFVVSFSAAIALIGNEAIANESQLPPPVGPVILEIGGKIAVDFSTESIPFDMAGLESLGTSEIVTETPWSEGEVTFTGVLFRDVLEAVGAHGNAVKAFALNDYSVTIPLTDLNSYDVIIATKRDGNPMRVRDRGPLWVIYPWSDHSDLRNEVYYARSIWQLRSLEVVE